MASSTMIPRAMIIANRLIMLMEPPTRYKIASVAMKDTGMPTITQKATRPLRNRNRMTITSASPPAPFLSNRSMRSRNNDHVSSKTSNCTPGGKPGRVSSTQSAMIRADSSESPASSRLTNNSTAGWPR